MPSPFPGMDPYLESPSYFPDFHHRFIVHLQEAIQRELPEPYYSKTEQRVWIEHPSRSVLPDVSILHRENPEQSRHGRGVALLEETEIDTETVDVVPGHEEYELFLELFVGRAGEPKTLVSVVELLSPSNKSTASPGRTAYLAKQAELLTRDVHLVEIDLLRGGRHTTAIPRESLKRPFDYHIAVRDRNFPPTRMYSYPIRLEDRLPKLAVPLLRDEGYVTVELQPVFDRCYDAGSYRREIDYRREQPDPPLGEAQLAWAQELIERWLNPPANSTAQ